MDYETAKKLEELDRRLSKLEKKEKPVKSENEVKPAKSEKEDVSK